MVYKTKKRLLRNGMASGAKLRGPRREGGFLRAHGMCLKVGQGDEGESINISKVIFLLDLKPGVNL